MDDYELQNARTWDDTAPEAPASSGKQFEWQNVGSSKKHASKKQQKQPVAPPPGNIAPRPLRTRPGPAPARAQRSLLPRSRDPAQQPQYLGAQAGRAAAPTQRRWESARGRHAAAKLAAPERPILPMHAEDVDSGAQMAWRQRQPPTDTIRISPDVALPEDTRLQLERLASSKGCFIFCEELQKGSGSLTFGLWGDPQDVAIAKDNLMVAAHELMPRGQSAGSFAKVCSLTPALRARHEKRWEREVRKNRYRQVPSPDMALRFGAVGSFHWPSNEYRPEEVLGLSFEALDPIRMDLSCYIVYLPELSIFRASGEMNNVQKAIVRIRQTCFQLAARSVNPVRAYLTRHSKDGDIPTHVYLEDYHGPNIVSPQGQVGEEGIQHSPRGEGFLEDEQQIEVARKTSVMNIERVRVTFANALRKFHYFRGQLQLRVRIATLVLIQYILPEDELYELEAYDNMTKESAFVGRVTEELGDRRLEQTLLKRMQQASDLLVPHDAMADNLSDVRPVYSATFIFEDERKGDLRLFISWHESEAFGQERPGLTRVPAKWARLDRACGTSSQLVDMSLTDLHTGMAWQFEIQAARFVERHRVSQQLQHFADNVQIDPVLALKQSTERPFVTYNPFVQLKSFRQKISYQYGIKGSDYTLEVSRFQDRSCMSRGSVVETSATDTFEHLWSLNIFRTEWDTMFSSNERLPIGEAANWDDSLEHWFSEDFGTWGASTSDGFRQLMEKLEKIETAIREPAGGE